MLYSALMGAQLNPNKFYASNSEDFKSLLAYAKIENKAVIIDFVASLMCQGVLDTPIFKEIGNDSRY